MYEKLGTNFRPEISHSLSLSVCLSVYLSLSIYIYTHTYIVKRLLKGIRAYRNLFLKETFFIPENTETRGSKLLEHTYRRTCLQRKIGFSLFPYRQVPQCIY
jgi:hypothetical protein